MPIQLHLLPDATAVAQALAERLTTRLREQPASVLALPSGQTPIAAYARLAMEPGLFAQATVFALDEFVGLGPNDPRSFAAFFRTHLFGPCGIPASRAHVLDGLAPDLDAEARRYEAAIAAAGGLDLTLLGLGANGHIAFNEPAQALGVRTHVVDLAAPSSAIAPRGITMGVGTLLAAPSVWLVATGPAKAKAVRRMTCGQVDPTCPASLLQLHPEAHVFLDTAAASEIAGI
ncbi:MAG: glucosamine-6-phosphate deaminase [Candidatus Sericytochromatia bacterium]|nr:glucosamine-6-phosphate deaminase [Candidatus Sericytochromatia bacterium]